MPSASQLAHDGLPFMNPISEGAFDRALAALRLPEGARIVETGCGSGEILLRALERNGSWSGVGIDIDPDAIAEAGRRAAERLPGRDVAFSGGDAAEISGSFDGVLNVASSHVHGGFPQALSVLRRLVSPGGQVLYGEGYWAAPPSEAFLEALGGATVDELPDLEGLRRVVGDVGFAIVHEELASEADWAAYEESLASSAERHGDEDSLAYARRIRERRAIPGGDTTLGFALLLLQA